MFAVGRYWLSFGCTKRQPRVSRRDPPDYHSGCLNESLKGTYSESESSLLTLCTHRWLPWLPKPNSHLVQSFDLSFPIPASASILAEVWPSFVLYARHEPQLLIHFLWTLVRNFSSSIEQWRLFCHLSFRVRSASIFISSKISSQH